MDQQRVLEIAQEAERMLDEASLFNSVVTSLVKKYTQDIVEADINSPESFAAHSKLKALTNIKEDLRVLANEGVVIKNNAKKGAAKERPFQWRRPAAPQGT